jgi:hypothetical protein
MPPSSSRPSPSSSFAIGAVPGLHDTVLVLQARRWRRRLRLLVRVGGVAMVVVVIGLLVIDGPRRVYPACSRAEAVARQTLQVAAVRQEKRMARGEAPATTPQALGVVDDAARGIRYALTDVDDSVDGSVDDSVDARFLLWAFIEAENDQRGAIVIDERFRLTTVMPTCDLHGSGFGGSTIF